MYKLFFSFFIAFLLISCTKDGDITMKYEQTQCADAWDYGNTAAQTTQNLGLFLDSARIRYSSLSFKKTNPGAVCAACSCVSGGVFTLTTTDQFVDRLIALGFKRK